MSLVISSPTHGDVVVDVVVVIGDPVVMVDPVVVVVDVDVVVVVFPCGSSQEKGMSNSENIAKIAMTIAVTQQDVHIPKVVSL